MRSTGRRSLSIGLIAVIALMALLLGAAAATAATIPIKGGEVDWGIKESFRDYIEGPIANGEVEVSGGAVKAADGTFAFPIGAGTYDTKSHTTEVEGTGTVHFTGHAGALDLTFSDPRVVLGTATGTVYVDARSKSLATGEFEEFPDLELAALDTSGVAPVFGAEAVSLDAIPAVLTADGTKVFPGFYPAGTALDPVGVTAAFEPTPPPTEEPTKPADNPPPTTAPTPAPAPAPAPEAPQVTPVAAAKVAGLAGVRTFGADGIVKLARLTCPSGGATCRTAVPKRLGAKIAGKRYLLRVMAPKKIGAGKWATVRVHVPKAARQALGAKQHLVKVKVAIHANGHTTKRVVKAKIAGRH
jgi:hypothetical protein